ncbi:MAG: SsrA-binding protein SmpB [Candidatus Omnitrophica bacterium]|nr:SsrA-binding protein SmpB [Candidatus Omnitrophota bacterium]
MVERSPEISNKQVYRDYEIEKKYEAGIVLFGNEIKSLRAGEVSLKGSFVKVDGEELFVQNMHITPYDFTREEQDPLRLKKLLLHRSEIRQIRVKLNERGYALLPLKIFFHRGYAKVELGLGKGKKFYDKRADIKKKEVNRDIAREIGRRR